MNGPLPTLEIFAAGFQNLANQALAYLHWMHYRN